MFYCRLKTSKLGNRAYVLKHLHGRKSIGPFEKNHEGSLWRGHGVVISFIL